MSGEPLGSTKASRRLGLARPSSFLAFCHDKASRCRAARMVSRQHRRPNRACTKSTTRFSVQRGFGSAPATRGLAASCWVARTSAPSAAAMSGQKGGGHRYADTAAPRGRAHGRHAASPSPSAGGGRYRLRRAWRSPVVRCHEGQGNARGCGHAEQSGPGGADPPTSVPNAHDQFVTLVGARPFRKTVMRETAATQPSTPTMDFKLDAV